jgi:hypothetical protein
MESGAAAASPSGVAASRARTRIVSGATGFTTRPTVTQRRTGDAAALGVQEEHLRRGATAPAAVERRGVPVAVSMCSSKARSTGDAAAPASSSVSASWTRS